MSSRHTHPTLYADPPATYIVLNCLYVMTCLVLPWPLQLVRRDWFVHGLIQTRSRYVVLDTNHISSQKRTVRLICFNNYFAANDPTNVSASILHPTRFCMVAKCGNSIPSNL